MPAHRPASARRADLDEARARSADLLQREREATVELADAEARHGELYAVGADASTIKRQAALIAALRTELNGIASGRAILTERMDGLRERLRGAEAGEALTAATQAHAAAASAVASWADYMSGLLGPDSDFERLSTQVRDAILNARDAAGNAMTLNQNGASQIEARFSQLWNAFPGLAALFNAVDAYRHTLRAGQRGAA